MLGKILVQKLWKANLILKWDERVPKEIEQVWNRIWHNIEHLEKIRIPRWLGTSHDVQLQIHGFANSSIEAYGCAIYLRIINLEGKIQCNLVASKSRVVPIKKV